MKLLLCLQSLFLFAALSAQSRPIIQLGFEYGLSNNFIVGITQDKDGFLWFATEEGLNKFDGTRFINYYKHTNSLSGNELNGIYADPDEPIVWIATQRSGLNAYNYEEDQLTVFTHDDNSSSLITNDVTKIIPAHDGNLWISTYHRGVDYLEKRTGTFIHYNKSTLPELVSENVWSIMDDGNGRLYIGHVANGLTVLSLKDRKTKNYRHDPNNPHSLPGDDIRCVYEDKHDNIWIGTDKGLALFKPDTETFIRLEQTETLLGSTIYDIRQTADDKLWVATELNGVLVINLKQHLFLSPKSLEIEHYTVGHSKFSLSNPTVRYVFQDSFRNIWLGTYGGGINFIGNIQPLFNDYSYSPIPTDLNSMNSRVVWSLCMDTEGRLWVGTDGDGINVFENGKRTTVYCKENGALSNNTVQTLFHDSQNNIWIGTFGGGVNCYNNKTRKFSRIALGQSANQTIRCFMEDEDKQIWIGTDEGVFILDPDNPGYQKHHTSTTMELPEDHVRSIRQDCKGRIWVGTFGRGLAIYTKELERIAVFDEYNGFVSNAVNYIFRNERNEMWVATGEGLACFGDADSLGYTLYGRGEGLLNTYIRAVAEDEKGNVWFSTNAGISCLQRSENQVVNFNHYDKTPMGSFVNAATTDKAGIIYFGSINGVRFFDPIQVLSNQQAPPPVITEFRVYEAKALHNEGKNLVLLKGKNTPIRLNHKESTFSITFNIQNYSFVNQTDYSYRLLGIDESWHTITTNVVTFHNIPPGSYEFQVRTQIKNQEWTNDVSSILINIAPPLWLSLWAKIGYLIIGSLIVFVLLYFYKKKVDIQSSYEMEKKKNSYEQDLNNERLRFYTNITHELRTPLTLILGPLDDLQNDTELPSKQARKISVVKQSAIRLLNLINQILEFRKTETQNKKLCVSKGNIASFVKETGLRYMELNTKPNLRFSIEVEQDYMPLYFDREVVQIILDNLISNAMKYTSSGHIELNLCTTVEEDVSYTKLMVSDTGRGIPEQEFERIFDRYYQVKTDSQVSGTGIGLALVKNLVTLHEGTITVDSRMGKGSVFSVSLLTNNIYPKALHKDETEKEEPEETQTGRTPTVPDGAKPILLVVEDDADIREYIAGSFADYFNVMTAEDGNEGLHEAFTHTPDLIISDIMMPGMDGVTFCGKVKEDIRTSHIPVILLTAKDTAEDKEAGYQSGADSYLTKPFSASLLHSRINNLLETRRKLAEQFSYSLQSNQHKESLNQLDNEFLSNLTRLIEDNLESEKMDITYLADKLSMSGSTLYRKVKALTGISTNEFARKIKMKNAEQLLLSGKYNISEVAFRVGMSSPVYFRQCFKEEFGLSPSEYLKRMKAR